MQIERPNLPTVNSPRAIPLRRPAIVAIAALACAALASACGGSSNSTTVSTKVDTGRIARSIEGTLLEKRKLHAKVVCPEVVPQEVGKKFECTATYHELKAPHAVKTSPFLVTIQTTKGYVTYEGQ